MWSRAGSRRCNIHRRLFSGAARRIEDEGDWLYSPEWWGSESESEFNGNTVFRSVSDKGNGVISVHAYPSSRPNKVHWPETEKWLQQRYGEIYPGYEHSGSFKILGYQWRVLRFNDNTRQSTVKIMAAYRDTEPGSIFIMQQAQCLAIPYVKSMVSLGLSTIASSKYDLMAAVHGKKRMHILCIGHGGGSLPLFLASKIQGAEIHVVEIDPIVISASVQAMGFPGFSVMTPSGERALLEPDTINEVMWKGIHERLYLYETDAEKYVVENNNLYDIIFVDAYDGDDIFPNKLWDPHSPFLNSLSDRLHPEHGTVVVNLHADSDISNPSETVSYFYQRLLPMGKYVSRVCKAYKDVLIRNKVTRGGKFGCGLGFAISVPWVCNTSLVVSRGFGLTSGFVNRDMVMNTLVSSSVKVDHMLNLPFSCLEYINIKRDCTLI
ncbi:hypothetical protein ERO13_D10G158400v2 [Gossypium hirsutum]|uniref:Uncharacterized protein isoform X1 n=4 Tax=Gossypium TaxID=3633 RepID=A0A1U8LZ97_GOSHI|nr:uncharacterized protein LOC107931362 isoform X1 [Gossypium hirsutum]KAB2009576.1 hypothetical protein ES319_D10G176100v1 [Gossypium barbadense]MBA0570801.1 hypothetical protein [Gossypium lobatum]TYG50618.1 hypothetical protein ES288_D10G189200v1 [Gossypium darwinii]KAG4126469.1 hypothetical protein ERO13_D10G158400v2 [Gossypium hirsutum]PPD86915.1 hypothetical protein GOBAR_DD16151 [Gossypium barbadense]